MIEPDPREGLLDLTLIVPPGVDQEIFPWGVLCLEEHLSKTGSPVNVRVWDLQRDEQIVALHQRHRGLLERLLLGLKGEALGVLFGITDTPELLLGVAAFLGEDFLAIARRNGLFKATTPGRRPLRLPLRPPTGQGHSLD